MKIKVESKKIVNAVKKLEGIEIVLENPNDAKEAIDLILEKAVLFKTDKYEGKLKEVNVASYQQYETSAVDYKLIFSLEFQFEEDVSLDTKLSFIKDLQAFFSQA